MHSIRNKARTIFASSKDSEVLILLSGGLDSTACLNFYIQFGRPPCGLFIDYGQPAAVREWQAVRAITDFYGVPVVLLRWDEAKPKSAGLVLGRNAFLVLAALTEKPNSVSVIALGIHGGTEYPDCTPDFVAKMQAVLDLYQEDRVQLAAPFLDWSKAEVIEYCLLKDVPTHLTYSCESGKVPCGTCLSCKDRDLLDARTHI